MVHPIDRGNCYYSYDLFEGDLERVTGSRKAGIWVGTYSNQYLPLQDGVYRHVPCSILQDFIQKGEGSAGVRVNFKTRTITYLSSQELNLEQNKWADKKEPQWVQQCEKMFRVFCRKRPHMWRLAKDHIGYHMDQILRDEDNKIQQNLPTLMSQIARVIGNVTATAQGLGGPGIDLAPWKAFQKWVKVNHPSL